MRGGRRWGNFVWKTIFGSLIVGLCFCGPIPCKATTALPSYFAEAWTTAPYTTTDTGLVSTPLASSTTPATELYYDPTGLGYNVLGYGQYLAGGIAQASADRVTGQLHAVAGETTYLTTPDTFGFYASTANAAFGDTLYFNVPDATATTVTTIGLLLQVDGQVSGGNASASLNVGSFTWGGDGTVYQTAGTPLFNLNGSFAKSWSYAPTPYSVNDDVTAIFSFSGPTAIVPILAWLQTQGQYGVADFSNTASLSFDLPTGVTFTTASGDLLTATPIPASLPLFATGLGCLVLLGWRRKRKPAALAACKNT
jgi:hypothetical protein